MIEAIYTFTAPSLQVCTRPACLANQAKGWDSIANTQGTPRATRAGFCSWCWSELKTERKSA